MMAIMKKAAGVALLLSLVLMPAQAGDAPASPKPAAGAQIPRVLLGKGVYWEHFQILEAMGELSPVRCDSAYFSRGSTMRFFDPSERFISQYSLVMAINLQCESFGPKGVEALDAYVRNGGSLFFFGGNYCNWGVTPEMPKKQDEKQADDPKAAEKLAASKQTQETLHNLLPCELAGARTKIDGGAPLNLTADGLEFFKAIKPDLAKGPMVFWSHKAKARQGAKVLATAGDEPVMFCWEVGKGRVVAFTGTAEGNPTGKQMAHWEWDGFPSLVAEASRWLIAPTLAATSKVELADDIKQKFSALPKTEMEIQPAQARKQVEELLPYCRDRQAASAIFAAARHCSLPVDERFGETLASTILPFASPEWAEQAEEMASGSNPGIVALGLKVLGAARKKEAAATLLKFLKDGQKAMAAEDSEGLESSAEMDGKIVQPEADDALKLAAIVGLGWTGDQANLKALRSASALYAKNRQNMLDWGPGKRLQEEAYQNSILARIRLGETEAVQDFATLLLKNLDDVEAIYSAFDDMVGYSKTYDQTYQKTIKVGREHLIDFHIRLATCEAMLPAMTEEQKLAFVLATADWKDPIRHQMALSALPQKLDAAQWKGIMEKCRGKALLRQAMRLLLATGQADAAAMATEILKKPAASKSYSEAFNALMLAQLLPMPQRKQVLEISAKQADEDFKRLADIFSAQ